MVKQQRELSSKLASSLAPQEEEEEKQSEHKDHQSIPLLKRIIIEATMSGQRVCRDKLCGLVDAKNTAHHLSFVCDHHVHQICNIRTRLP